jgi:hypothetical protein
MAMAPQALNLSQIKQAVDSKSGYPFELDIARRIETDEDYTYFVESNYSFEDQDTGEARELDFRAIQAVPISTKRSEYVFLVILGSCKTNKNPYIFFTREIPLAGITLNLNMPIAGYPLEIFTDSEEREDIEWYFRFHDFLHILDTDILSTQFCEVVKVSSGWKVQSGNLFNDVVVPLVKVLYREIEEYNTEHKPSSSETSPDYQIFYPLLVLNGPMLEYHLTPEGSTELRETNHILIVKHYESKTVRGRYAIDVIHETYLKQHLDLINREASKFVNLIRRHRKPIAKSIQRLSEQNQVEGQDPER